METSIMPWPFLRIEHFSNGVELWDLKDRHFGEMLPMFVVRRQWFFTAVNTGQMNYTRFRTATQYWSPPRTTHCKGRLVKPHIQEKYRLKAVNIYRWEPLTYNRSSGTHDSNQTSLCTTILYVSSSIVKGFHRRSNDALYCSIFVVISPQAGQFSW